MLMMMTPFFAVLFGEVEGHTNTTRNEVIKNRRKEDETETLLGDIQKIFPKQKQK